MHHSIKREPKFCRCRVCHEHFYADTIAEAKQACLEHARGGGDAMKKQTVTLFLCGDVMTGRGIDQILPHPSAPRLYESYVNDAREYVELAEQANGPVPRPVDEDYIWGDALAVLQRTSPDLRIINLETAITTSDSPWPKGINYRMHPKNISCLTAAGVDCCALANNHVLDWGEAGLMQTLATLTAAGIHSAGAGRNLEEARAPAVMALPGKGRVVVFSCAAESSGIGREWGAETNRPGLYRLPDLSDATVQNLADQVQGVKQEDDIVVASIHWGGNWGYTIPSEQRAFAHALIDSAGIDVVHGHSSHHVKGIEVYKAHPIIYGCGDFINDYEGISGYEQYRDDLGLMYFPILDPAGGRLLGFEMTAMRIKKLRLNYASPQETRWLVDVLNREGETLGTKVSLVQNHRLALQWNGC